MAEIRLGIIMHGVTGRMGMNQHLIRSILAIREQGGVKLTNGDRVVIDPIVVGRNAEKIEALVNEYGIDRWTTDIDTALANPDDTVFFDAATTQLRARLLKKAMGAGKHIYCEKPTAENLVIYFADILNRELPQDVKLESIVLFETANSYAEWLAADQNS